MGQKESLEWLNLRDNDLPSITGNHLTHRRHAQLVHPQEMLHRPGLVPEAHLSKPLQQRPARLDWH